MMTQNTGRLFARYARSLIMGRGASSQAAAFAASQGWANGHVIVTALKSAVGAISTSDVDDAMRPIGLDFAEFLRPSTLIGRIPGFREAVFRTRMLVQTAGAVGAFVAEGGPIPVSAAGFDQTAILDVATVGAITVATSELVRLSNPKAESILAADMGRAVGLAMDSAFINPSNAGDSATPAAISNGAPSFMSSGSTLSAIDSDLARLLKTLTEAGISLDFAVWVMPSGTAASLALMRGSGGASAYPFVTCRGGSLLGLPVFTSDAAIQPGSPGASSITLLAADNVLLADDGDSAIDFSNTAALQMSSTPSSSAASQVSLWQNNLVGVRATRTVRWERRRPEGVAVLTGVGY